MKRTGNARAFSANAKSVPSEGFGDSTIQTHGMFKAIEPALNQNEVNQFLKHVALGEQDVAEKMLKETPGLVLGKGTCTDHAGRTFEEITGFQYALWALDWHMWEMILPAFDELAEGKSAAREQCESQESFTEGLGHGARYKMEDLVGALKAFVDKFDALSKDSDWSGLAKLWVGVGIAQRETVAHVIQTYLNNLVSFAPCPDWRERADGGCRGVVHPNWHQPNVSWVRGSTKVVCMRAGYGYMHLWAMKGQIFRTKVRPAIHIDQAAMENLCKICSAQLSELKSSLVISSLSAHR